MKTTKLIVFALLLATMAISGCSKEKLCEKNRTAETRFTNNSNNPYKIYIDGAYKTILNGNTFKDFTVKEGTREFKAIQESGYVLYPTERKTTEYVTRCVDITFTIP